MPLRRVTNVDAKRGKKKSIWYEDSAHERIEDTWGDKDGRPSRYGPKREYVANCRSLEIADRIVQALNSTGGCP